jgi:Glycosyltransferase family 87
MRTRFTALSLTVSFCALIVVAGVVAFAALTTVFGSGGTDWLSFYSAGTMIRTGHGRELFDTAAQAATQHRLFGRVGTENAFPLPAFVAYVFAAFSFLSFPTSYLAWLAINLSLLAGLLYAAWRYLVRLPGSVRNCWIAGVALATPTVLEVFQGQIDLFLLTCLLACLALLSRKKQVMAGVLLALAAAKPQFLLSVLLLLLLKKEWRALVSFGVVAAVLFAVPLALLSPHTLGDQISLVASYPSSSTDHSVSARYMVNLRGTVTSIHGSAGVWEWALPLAACSTVALVVAGRRWVRLPSSDPQAWALALTLPLIWSPHVHYQSLVFLLAAGTMYVRALSEAGVPPRPSWIMLVQYSVTGLWLVSYLGVGLVSFLVIGAFVVFAYAWPRPKGARSLALSKSPKTILRLPFRRACEASPNALSPPV